MLRGGSRVHIRPIRPDDKGALAEGFARLSPESRYKRFLAPVNELRPRDLRYLTEVDHHAHEALVAQAPDGEPLGVARYVRDDGGAEAAVAVVDHWQGRGLGTALLTRLAARASEEGIDHFTAMMLATNHEMLALLNELGPADVTGRADGVLEVQVRLPIAAEEPATPLRRTLRGAAAGELETRPGTMARRAGEE